MLSSKQRGLTLVELMVVVAVMAIIATVAYPLYTAQVQKTRRADAKVALQAVALAQERFYTINGSYATAVNALSIDPAVPDSVWQSNQSEQGYYAIGLANGTNQDFTLTATAGGAQADDGDCAQFTINHQGVKTATDGGSTNCW
jgi:type IV pilus assembly protein PilE